MRLLVTALVVCVSSLMVGCAPTECDKSADHLAECLNIGSTGNMNKETVACEGLSLCNARCTSNATCDQIKDFYGSMPTEKSKALLDCTTLCATSN